MLIDRQRRIIYDQALRYLRGREHTRFQLMTKLSARFSGDSALIIAVLDELERLDLQSDRRYVEAFVRTYMPKYGHSYIIERLRQSGVETSLVSEVMSPIDDEASIQSARKLLLKRSRHDGHSFSAKDHFSKEFKFLQRRGFSNYVIRKALELELPDLIDH